MICIKELFCGALHFLRSYYHLSHDRCHQRLSLIGGLLHFLVTHLYRIVEATEVGDDGDTKGTDATVVSHNHLRNGRHAHSIATQQMVHLIFCRRLEGRSLYADINAVLHLDTLLCGNPVGQSYQCQIVGLVHIREPRTGGEVLATQRMLGEEVDMVGDDHQVADAECGVHTASGVADEKRLDAQFVHHTDRECHLLHRVSLVEVEAALHSQDIHTTEFAEDQFAAVALDGGYGKVRNLRIGKLRLVSYF